MKKRKNLIVLFVAVFFMFMIVCNQPEFQHSESETNDYLINDISIQKANMEVSSIFCGGVSGIADLAKADNSDHFRAGGGNIYLHHSGWVSNRITEAERQSVINTIWNDRAFGIELGYHSDNLTAWPHTYEVNYHNRGIRPAFITLNAFSSDRIPNVDFFRRTIQAYRDKGVTGKIFATFEYQNFPGRIPTLANNKVSQRSDFQNIIRESGGLTIDTPSAVFFRREQNYRNWVIDAIKWAKNNGYIVGIIISPNSSRTNYDEDTKNYIDYLKNENAMPSFYVVENYSTEDESTYTNIVGNEDTPHHQLGCAYLLQTQWAPSPNRAPSVSITRPTASTFNAGSSISVVAAASDSDGTVRNVKLYLNNSLVRQENHAPYEWNQNGQDPALSNLSAGSYTLKVVATDNDGATKTATKTIIVSGTPVGPAGYTYCCMEGQSYTFNQTVDVAYGANGQFNYKTGITGTITFNNAAFGDPIYGVRKAGFYKISGGGGSVTVLTSDDKNKEYTVNGTREFKIPTGNSGVIQVLKPWQQDVKVSINGGTYKATPEDWGGEFNAPANSNVSVKVKTTSSLKVKFNWW